MTLSIILPTYNGGKFLRPQLDSILAQTDDDLELIAIDDGSKDDTVAILDEYAARDRRMRRLPSTGNIGQRLRLRQLVKSATADLVAVADQDDVWAPDRNERLLASLGDNAVVFGRSQLIDSAGHDLGRSILEELSIDPRTSGPLSTLFQPQVSAHAAIFRRDWLDPGVFSGPVPFDWIMSVEAMLSDGLAYVDGAAVRHRIHGGNQMNGGVFVTRNRLLSHYWLRASTSFVRSRRLYFFVLIDQISRSSAVSKDVRRAFADATNACRYAWYQPLRFVPRQGYHLRRVLHNTLDHFASSEVDLNFFTRKIEWITRSQVAPTNLVRAIKSYVTRQYD